MRNGRWIKPLTLVLVAALASGCESGTGPEDAPTFDAELALADHQALESILQSNSMAGFRAMAGGVTFFGGGAEAELALELAANLDAPTNPETARAYAGRMVRLASEVGMEASRNPIISVFRRGKTFVYDPDLERYVIDQDLAGAPETGVRFILYSPGGNGKPDPGAEIGHVDLIDLGDDSAEEISLRLVVVEGVDTILDYGTTLDIMAQGGKVTVTGFVQGDDNRLDFEILVQGSAQPGLATMDVDFEMGIEARDFLITGTVQGVAQDSGDGGQVNLSVRHGEHSFQVDVTGTETSIDGTFKLNEQLFATVTGHPDSPTLTGASGGPLTLVEVLVLRQIIDSTEDVFDLFEDLLDPVDELVILAIIF